jgi:hypothetical protein
MSSWGAQERASSLGEGTASGSSCWRPTACVAAAGDGGATWRGGQRPARVG